MAQIKFAPISVSQTATRVFLTDAGGSVLTLKLPDTTTARIVYAALILRIKGERE